MHIPDGMLSPETYIPATVAAAGFWAVSLRKLKTEFDPATLPLLGALSALVFLFSLITLPVPGGTLVHASGIGIMVLCFGVYESYLAYTIVLLVQALYFGMGGVTTLGFNSLAQGLFAAAVVRSILIFPGQWIPEDVRIFLAVFLSMTLTSLVVAFILGLQPLIGSDAAGNPLYFPFGWEVTLPAVVLPNLWIALGEAILTVGAVRYFRRVGIAIPAQ